MTLFSNSVIITLGILCAASIFIVVYRLLVMGLIGLQARSEKAKRAEAAKHHAAYFADRQRKLEDAAAQLLAADPIVASLVNDIRELPYIDAKTREARRNNGKRASMQKTLRKLVPSKPLRDIFYTS